MLSDSVIFTDTDRFDRLEESIRALGFSGRRIMIIADTNTASLYLPVVRKALLPVAASVHHAIIPAGEENKTLDNIAPLYRAMIASKMERGDLVVALGGGVVGDMAGFMAATYLRGVTYVQIPTTLLSMTDSSVGGKTGVDLDGYKNMVGAFHMPGLVFINTATLKTLDAREFSCGMAEIIKHGLIRDPAFYSWLKEQRDRILSRDSDILLQMIRRSVEIKWSIVTRDPEEKGERRLLNFGHSVGHAIEKLSGFALTHGECVALGSVAAAAVSEQMSRLSAKDVSDLTKTFASFNLPVSLSACLKDTVSLDPDELLSVLHADKKSDAGKLHFVLLDGIGSAFTDTSVEDDMIRMALKKIA